jgi:thymidylate synthase (FAD)
MDKQASKAVEMANNLDLTKQLDPLGDGISSVELVRVSGADVDVVNAARVSFGKVVTTMTERDKKLVRYLVMHDHTSPFEHNQLSFRVKTPIFVARQWMRHRMHSYNEISYRYVKAATEFYVPGQWRYQDKVDRQASTGEFQDLELNKQYQAAIDESYRVYEHLLEQGVAREIARGVLPMCTYTEFIFTSNLHALMHFLRLRTDSMAQYEIRCFALAMLRLAEPHFPVSLGAWMEKYKMKHDH